MAGADDRPATEPAPRLAPRLSLIWKALILLTFLLGNTYSYLGYLGYSSLKQQNERERQQQMERFGQALDALLERAGDELARLATSMATLTRTRNLDSQDVAERPQFRRPAVRPEPHRLLLDGWPRAGALVERRPSAPPRPRRPARTGAQDASAGYHAELCAGLRAARLRAHVRSGRQPRSR